MIIVINKVVQGISGKKQKEGSAQRRTLAEFDIRQDGRV
jgi:hypothetical protein